MDEDFKLQDELAAYQDGTMVIEYEIPIEDSSTSNLVQHINYITESLGNNCMEINQPKIFDGIRSFIKNLSKVSSNLMNRMFDILITGFRELIKVVEEDYNDGNFPFTKLLDPINRYSYLVCMLIHEAEANRKAEKAIKAAKSKSSKSQARTDPHVWDWPSHQGRLFETIYKIMQTPLKSIFTSNQSVEALTGAFVKCMFSMLESQENLKIGMTRSKAFHVISMAAKNYGHGFSIQTTLLQNLQYYEHLYDPMAELAILMLTDYDYPQLIDEVMKDIANRDFTPTDKIGPKSFSSFLIKVCELSPKSLNKFIGILIKHVDSEAYALRCGMVEIVGLLIHELVKAEMSDSIQSMIEKYFDILEERFKDLNYLVRCRVLQVCAKITELKAKFPKRRPRLIHLIVGRLEDKSNFVRKNAIKALIKFIKTHPFLIDGGALSYELFESKHKAIVKEMLELQQAAGLMALQKEPSRTKKSKKSFKKDHEESMMEDETDHDESMMDEGEEDEEEEGEDDDEDITPKQEVITDEMTASKFIQLKLKESYYQDAIFFVDQLKAAIAPLIQLLISTNKSEAMESMDFFVQAYHYQFTQAKEGLKKMIHLVWTKDNSDEGKGILSHLKDNFYDLYLVAPLARDEKEKINTVARNLIELVLEAKFVDLISLEELMRLLTLDHKISEGIIDKLWGIYGYTKKEFSSEQRRGAIIILSMIGKAKPEMISERMEVLMKIGLGEIGKADFEIAKYTCIALQCLSGSSSQKIKGTINLTKRIPTSETLFVLLKDLIEVETRDYLWFDMSEQAIKAIYDLAQRPDQLCQTILQNKAKILQISSEQADDEGKSDPWPLSQFIFIAGHVAIKHIVFLEIVEAEQRLLKATHKADQSDGDLENVGASAEDEVTDLIHAIREKELLFGPKSLLKMVAKIVVDICSDTVAYSDPTLQKVATLALAKLMCVSSTFCQQQLPLLLLILQNSQEPIIRSNVMIALGDVAACFNSLIGENMGYMYQRLQDQEPAVKKNALMVLTHLVLNGMVKVKGQLGEMAKCLVDPDRRVSDLAKLFFTELANKDNAIYNNLPDIISHLSKPPTNENEEELDPEYFRRIMKFLFDFIKDKERQCENVVDKLCQRFKHLENDRQWRDVGYCLSLIPYKSEKTFKKLVEHLPLFQDHLYDTEFFNFLTDCITRAKQHTWQRGGDMSNVIEDFETAIITLRDKMDPDHSAENTESESEQESTCSAIDN